MKLRSRFDSPNYLLSDWLGVYVDGRIGEELVKAVRNGETRRINYIRTKFLRTEVRTISRVVAGWRLSDDPEDMVEHYIDWRSQERVPGTDRFVSAARIEREVNILIAALRWLSKVGAPSIGNSDVDHHHVVRMLSTVRMQPVGCVGDLVLDANELPAGSAAPSRALAATLLRKIIEPIWSRWV